MMLSALSHLLLAASVINNTAATPTMLLSSKETDTLFLNAFLLVFFFSFLFLQTITATYPQPNGQIDTTIYGACDCVTLRTVQGRGGPIADSINFSEYAWCWVYPKDGCVPGPRPVSRVYVDEGTDYSSTGDYSELDDAYSVQCYSASEGVDPCS